MSVFVLGGGGGPGSNQLITLPILLHGYNLSSISMYDTRILKSDKNLKYEYLEGSGFDFIECFTTTFLRAHSWLNWVWRVLEVVARYQIVSSGVPYHRVYRSMYNKEVN